MERKSVVTMDALLRKQNITGIDTREILNIEFTFRPLNIPMDVTVGKVGNLKKQVKLASIATFNPESLSTNG
jgi:hypothetical protein